MSKERVPDIEDPNEKKCEKNIVFSELTKQEPNAPAEKKETEENIKKVNVIETEQNEKISFEKPLTDQMEENNVSDIKDANIQTIQQVTAIESHSIQQPDDVSQQPPPKRRRGKRKAISPDFVARTSGRTKIKAKFIDPQDIKCHYCNLRDLSSDYIICDNYPRCRRCFCFSCLNAFFNEHLLEIGKEPPELKNIRYECPVCQNLCRCEKCVNKVGRGRRGRPPGSRKHTVVLDDEKVDPDVLVVNKWRRETCLRDEEEFRGPRTYPKPETVTHPREEAMKINPNSAEGPVPAKIPWTFPPNPMCYFPFTNPMMATQSRNGSIPPAPVGGLPAEPTRLNQEEEKKQHGNSQVFPKIPGANPSITIPTGSFPRSVTELSQMQYYQMMQYQAQYMAMMNYYQSMRPPSNRPPDPDSKS